ncbi:unnamed protein product [Chironomus riparius]|uniref:Uncharacterized protein n=1 Tax=Chironomus riparius TaxID=315576 RepID=A0A9N9WYY6_9DIPT|nr:unnamed protein product [Chironomus riparius]
MNTIVSVWVYCSGETKSKHPKTSNSLALVLIKEQYESLNVSEYFYLLENSLFMMKILTTRLLLTRDDVFGRNVSRNDDGNHVKVILLIIVDTWFSKRRGLAVNETRMMTTVNDAKRRPLITLRSDKKFMLTWFRPKSDNSLNFSVCIAALRPVSKWCSLTLPRVRAMRTEKFNKV